MYEAGDGSGESDGAAIHNGGQPIFKKKMVLKDNRGERDPNQGFCLVMTYLSQAGVQARKK